MLSRMELPGRRPTGRPVMRCVDVVGGQEVPQKGKARRRHDVMNMSHMTLIPIEQKHRWKMIKTR